MMCGAGVGNIKYLWLTLALLEYDDGANSPICQLRIPRKLRRDDKIGYETLPAYTRHGYRYQHNDIVMSDIRKLFTLKTSTINFPIHH